MTATNERGGERTASLATTWLLFVTLVREDWRLHARLFGGRRFALFPLVIAVLAVGGAGALVATGTDQATILVGLHVLALGFGLYSGTAAFAGSAMLEDVFGDLSAVLSTARTLPISRRRLLATFLVKDVLFYGVVFVFPMALSAAVLSDSGVGAVPATLLAVGRLWLSLCLVFAAGTTVTVALIAGQSRGVPMWASGPGIAALTLVAWIAGAAETMRTALVPTEGDVLVAVGLAAATLVCAAAALASYDPTYGRPSRSAGDASARFEWLRDRLPFETDALVAKTVLELARSPGGVWKPFVSAAILLALVAALVGVVESITGVAPAPGIFFGGVLGLSAFTTYNWLTQFDALEDYLCYPVSIADVFRAKRTAYVLVGTPAVAVPYLAAVLRFGTTLTDAVVGALLLGGYALYYYGLTVYLAGFDPNEFLFDAVRFGLFTVGVAVPLVPALVAGFAVVPPTGPVAAALAAAGIGVGLVGYVLGSRAGPRWDARYRNG